MKKPCVFTTQGTPYSYLERSISGLVTEGDYEAADSIDLDGDGNTTWEEYVAGTDPTDPVSSFQIVRIENHDTDQLLVRWKAIPWKIYNIYASDNLDENNWEIVASDILGVAPQTEQMVALEGSPRFLKNRCGVICSEIQFLNTWLKSLNKIYRIFPINYWPNQFNWPNFGYFKYSTQIFIHE